MREPIALMRARWLTTASYRTQLVLSVGGLLASIVPLYFVADALQPVMADAIRDDGGQAFAFLLVGLATFSLVTAAVNLLPQEIGGGVSNGTLEALLATPTPTWRLLGGLAGFGIGWTMLRVALLMLTGWALGAQLIGPRLPIGALIVALIVLAHLPFGVMAAALILAFRTAGPLPRALLFASALLGGVYYPTDVIPAWLRELSQLLPLTYGLRALRRTVLEGAPLAAIAGDLAILAAATIALSVVAALCFRQGLLYARRTGTLAQY